MNFHILSDIHLEFRYYSVKSHVNKQNRCGIPENEEINLILAGDVGYPDKQSFVDFISSCVKLYDNVFMVIGNHEYYKKDLVTAKELLRNISHPNFFLLDNETVLHKDVYIIGSTLWTETDPEKIKGGLINDYSLIKNFTLETSYTLFKESKKFLNESILKAENELKKCIVITHHMPSFELIHPIYKGGEINVFFASNCDELIKSPVVLWAYGHTHTKGNHRINNVELICNPKGYPSEYSGYSKTVVFRI